MNTKIKGNNTLANFQNFFASIKLTVVVLILLAATSILGTLIPQNAQPSAYVNAYGDFGYRLLYIFDLPNMYHSWWFKTLICLLVVNVIICTLKRWPATRKIVFSKKQRFSPAGKKQPLAAFADPREPEELKARYTAYFNRKFRSYCFEPYEQGFGIMAAKGRWSRLSVPVVHLSIVLVLAGALAGSFFGFDGYASIPEGGSAERIQLSNSNGTRELGFKIRCDDFEVSFYDNGSPAEFRSSLVVLEDGREVVSKDITVNDPLRYKGINFFQSSYGKMPPKTLEMTFKPKESGTTVTRRLSIGGTVKIPNQGGRFTIREYKRDFHFRGSEVGEAVIGVLEKPGKEPVDVTLPLRFPSFDKMRKGQWIISAQALKNAYYTGLKVIRDPGVPLVYAGFILLMAGCWMTFFMSHRKILIDVQEGSSGSRVRVFGSTNRNRVGFEMMMAKFSEKLQQL